jgi:hypothetical protein
VDSEIDFAYYKFATGRIDVRKISGLREQGLLLK